ncbi:MAG: 2-nitropropane dioxygenase, partial [Phycisphaerae bacterium]
MGWWTGAGCDTDADALRRALLNLRLPVYMIQPEEAADFVVTQGGSVVFQEEAPSDEALPVIGYAPALRVSQLGDGSFCADHGIRFPYMTGAMANGIASVELVEAVARAGMLGSFGAAGLRVSQIEEAIDRLAADLGNGIEGGLPYCFNLIHSPNEPAHEAAVVELYLRRGIHLVE